MSGPHAHPHPDIRPPQSNATAMITPDHLSALALGAWLLMAAVSDLRSRRIPNRVVAGGMLCGFALQVLAPGGAGLFHFWWGGLGAVPALLGLLAGFALFLPLHLLRVIGAGDVKLLAMVGVWLGPQLLLGTTVLTLMAGGVMSIVMMLASGTARRVLGNVRTLLTSFVVGAHAGHVTTLQSRTTSGVRMPYALAIAAGTAAQVAWVLTHAHP